MNSHYARHHNRELGTVWFVVPLLAICATLLVLILLSKPASSAPPQSQAAAATAATAAPYVSSDPSLPSAGSVFNDGSAHETAQHVDTF
jgi:hypothetical protein